MSGNRGWLAVMSMGLALGVGLGAWSASARAEGARELDDKKDMCGKAGLPDCPYQAWMKDNMVKPKAAGEWARLEIAFDKVGKTNPFDKVKETKEYEAWLSAVRHGIDAAKAQKKDDVNGACNECHTAARKTFRAKYRDTPLPK
jgi:hypothetical protein